MAAPIYVRTKELVISDAKKASSCIEDAISAMSKVDNAVSGWDLYIDAAADGFVFAKSESEVGACLSALRTKQTQLEKLISVMQTGTEKLEEADAGFKNEITDPNLWERLTTAVGRAIYSSTFGKVDALIIGVAWLSSLFSPGTKGTAEITYQHIIDQYDWSKTKLSEDDVKEFIEKEKELARMKGERLTDAQIQKKLQDLYDRNIIPVHVEVQVKDYSEGVSRGSIRYCNQNPKYSQDNGWRSEHRYSSGGMCNRACESMALSYIGVDQSPSSMHDTTALKKLEFASSGVIDGYKTDLPAVDGTATVEVSGGYYKGNFNRDALNELVQRYEDDNGTGVHSPVLLHYDKTVGGKYHSHWILITEINEDGSYQAIGPWSSDGTNYERNEFTVHIDNNGVVSGSGFSGSNEGRSVAHIAQYSRVD